MIRPALLLLACCAFIPLCHGNEARAWFSANKGQWPAQVLYRATLPGGAVFVEKDALTFVVKDGGPAHSHGHAEEHAEIQPYRAHAYRVSFIGGAAFTHEGAEQASFYENYFIGNDKSLWAGHVPVYGVVELKDVYPGIDLRLDASAGLKYEFLVAPGADPSRIMLQFEGHDGLAIQQGDLVVSTTAGKVFENAPYSFQLVDGTEREVKSRFVLNDDTVRFAVGKVHDPSLPLVIDPILTFASYSGSTADNFGFTASYDASGHLYGGGIVFGIGYPTTLGVVQAFHGGSTIDIGVTKFDANGTSLLWSTYIGGNGNESPHSLVVNDNEELFILASTGSSDFPVTPGCFDGTFNGGTFIDVLPGGWVGLSGGYGYGHISGTDIAVVHLSADATSLIGSTYVGGTANDGLNNTLPTCYNYGDAFRGEIALDPQQRPVIATSTNSGDAPTSTGAPFGTYRGGAQDGYAFRLSADLTTLQWGTFFGGSDTDSGFGVQFDSAGQIFITGGTVSGNIPIVGNAFQPANSGDVDGWVARFDVSGATLLSSTYLGTNSYDQTYFVQLDPDDDVYVVGQTHGTYPITPGKYVVPGSSQFIQKLSHDLSTSLWSTVVGSGLGNEDLSPSAFLVSDCKQIYFSCWGGQVNNNAVPNSSTTNGLATTPGTFQSNTDGSDFYLMVLEPDAAALDYATFFGGPSSAEHVDGGTSRFDKNGNVYQAICAGCGSLDDLPTTPGAWSTTNGSSNCNLGVVKFNLAQLVSLVAIDGPPYACTPDTVHFLNLSSGGNSYFWDFGDGTSSTEMEPSHYYDTPGFYTVTMVLVDTLGCAPGDTATVVLEMVDPLDAAVDSVPPLCPGASVQLNATGGTDYVWVPALGLSSAFIPDPLATPPGPMTYTVAVTDQCGTDSVDVEIIFAVPNVFAGPDTLMCVGDSIPISAFGGGTYSWSPANLVTDPLSNAPLAFPPDTMWYHVDIISPEGCPGSDSLLVLVQFGPPVPTVGDTAICLGNSVQLLAEGGDIYTWLPAPGIIDLIGPDPVVEPVISTYYIVQVSNSCGVIVDSAFVLVREAEANAWPDTLVCPNEPVQLHASGGVQFLWNPAAGLDSATSANPMANVGSPTTFTVQVTDVFGCEDEADLTISLYPAPTVDAGPDQLVGFGDPVHLYATGSGTFAWTPSDGMIGHDTRDPSVVMYTTTTFTVTLTDENGCKITDQVVVAVDGTLYVPNTFTPNGDGINDVFFALGKEIDTFRLLVFDRWGEQIFKAEELDQFWDGTYSGVLSPIDTYVWRVDYSEISGKKHTVFGHVNLVR